MNPLTKFMLALAGVIALVGTPALAQKGQGKGPGGGQPPSGAPGRSGAPQTPGAPSERGPKVEPTSHHPGSIASVKKTPGELIVQNEKLSSRLAAKLPAGTDLQLAAGGFKHLGDFVSAVHVSNNLGIPFADLKSRIGAGDTLGEAIRALKPGVDTAAEARRAQKQAEKELKETGAPR